MKVQEPLPNRLIKQEQEVDKCSISTVFFHFDVKELRSGKGRSLMCNIQLLQHEAQPSITSNVSQYSQIKKSTKFYKDRELIYVSIVFFKDLSNKTKN